ncbi:MAG: hypothetical protein HY923_09425, partial [Elusimicrobia bacterium]|nr:hypothetical protein [Elusimicrobiota bacterium]
MRRALAFILSAALAAPAPAVAQTIGRAAASAPGFSTPVLIPILQPGASLPAPS